MEFLAYVGTLVKKIDLGDKSGDLTNITYLSTLSLLKQIHPEGEEEIAIWICGILYLSLKCNKEKEKIDNYLKYIELFSEQSDMFRTLIGERMEFLVPLLIENDPLVFQKNKNLPLVSNEIKNPFQQIQTVYINLERRFDRRKNIEFELQRMGIKNYQRFKAIDHQLGCYGCTQSHTKVLNQLQYSESPFSLVLEDDFNFIDDIKKVYQDIYGFLNLYRNNFDVVLLTVCEPKFFPCKQNENKTNVIDKGGKVKKLIAGHTAAGYLINNNYIPTLKKCFEESGHLLLHTKEHWNYAIDQYWKRLQKKDRWFAFDPPLGYQIKSKSDTDINVLDIVDDKKGEKIQKEKDIIDDHKNDDDDLFF